MTIEPGTGPDRFGRWQGSTSSRNELGCGSISAARIYAGFERQGRSLEAVLQRELHRSGIVDCLVQCAEARSARGRGLAKRGRYERTLRRIQIRMIGEIEDLPLELDLLPFGDREIFPQAGIHDDRSGTK